MRGSCHTILGGCVLVLAGIGGCYSGPKLGLDGPGRGGETSTDVSGTDPAETQSAEVVADLPCDVASALGGACSSCHGTTLAEGARLHLISRADLAAPLATDPSRTVADLCLIRMKSERDPMPPAAPVAPNAVSVLEKWIAAGKPAGTCSAAGIDYGTARVCTSKKKWTEGAKGDEVMNPGEACISCHKQEAAEGEHEAKIFSVAGTLYPTAHEPDNCNGVDGVKNGATVIITDATGKSFVLDVNEAGNFMTEEKMKKPLRAKVKRGELVYEMQGEIKDGDCNACHTEAGRADEGAEYPRGRIVLP